MDDGALPASLRALLAQAPAELVDACLREWDELVALQDRLVAESKAGVDYEASESGPMLQHVMASLDAEEVRWRDGAMAIERRWLSEREALLGWWRSDDAAALHQQVEAASLMAVQLADAVSALPPSRLSAERLALGRTLGIRRGSDKDQLGIRWGWIR